MVGQEAPDCGSNSQHRRAPAPDIHTLIDDLLLKIFYHCRPVLSDENTAGGRGDHNIEERKWVNEHWWYKFTHICRRWRHLVLASASQLHLCLFCTRSSPVADMLTYLPEFPLIIDYGHGEEEYRREVTVRDEEGILLALHCRRRVRRIRLWLPAPSLRRLLATMDGEFPMLEHLYIKPLTNDDNYGLSLPRTFNAPHLRHFVLRNITHLPDMFQPPPRTPRTPPMEGNSQVIPYYGPPLRSTWRSLRMFVHILDDDSLLNIFHFCRPVLVDEDETSDDRILQGGEWHRERWWYKPAHVCRRWRRVILVSASHLGLCLVCTHGTPVADMLTNSPPLPLIIDHIHGRTSITAEDEEGIVLALQHRHRVHRIRFSLPLVDLQRLILAVDEEFPLLEHLFFAPASATKCNSWLKLPSTFRAPHLRHLVMKNFEITRSSPLIMTNPGPVTLSLQRILPSVYPHPDDLLQQVSLMPQLETLRITFHYPVPSRDLEGRLMQKPVTTRVILPNLRWLVLRASNTYMEAFLPQVTTPLLERFEPLYFHQLNFSVPHLLKFMSAAENLRFGSAEFRFLDHGIDVIVYPDDDAPMYSFLTDIKCKHIDWQVSFAGQVFSTLGTIFSSVDHLYLIFWGSFKLSEVNNDVDLKRWRELLRSFSNVKILYVNEDFRGQISRSLQVDDGEPPLELLPQLKELHYPSSHPVPESFNAFIDSRRNTGHPVTLVRH